MKLRFVFVIILTAMLLMLTSNETTQAQDTSLTQDTLILTDTTKFQLINIDDGSQIVGHILFADADYVTVKTEIGEITISWDRITSIKTVPKTSVKSGKYWYKNPDQTRLYIAPTARMLKAGEGYFMDAYLFFPAVTIGVTDWLTMGGGISLLPGVKIEDQLLYFTPKIGFSPSEKVSLALGAWYIFLPDNETTIGVVWGIGTFGSPIRSVTIGLGYGYTNDDMADEPAFLLGADLRISRKTSFVTENWIIPGVDNPVISYGVRFLGKSHSVDLGFFNSWNDDTFIPGIPYFNFVYNF